MNRKKRIKELEAKVKTLEQKTSRLEHKTSRRQFICGAAGFLAAAITIKNELIPQPKTNPKPQHIRLESATDVPIGGMAVLASSGVPTVHADLGPSKKG